MLKHNKTIAIVMAFVYNILALIVIYAIGRIILLLRSGQLARAFILKYCPGISVVQCLNAGDYYKHRYPN